MTQKLCMIPTVMHSSKMYIRYEQNPVAPFKAIINLIYQRETYVNAQASLRSRRSLVFFPAGASSKRNRLSARAGEALQPARTSHVRRWSAQREIRLERLLYMLCADLR